METNGNLKRNVEKQCGNLIIKKAFTVVSFSLILVIGFVRVGGEEGKQSGK